MRRLAAVDAQTYWLSAKIPNDQFLVYGFAGRQSDLERAIDTVHVGPRLRGTAPPDPATAMPSAFPAWVSADVEPGQFTVHELDDNNWAGCLAAVNRLACDQLDPRVWAWRLHIFTPVNGISDRHGTGNGCWSLQMSHALADGARSSALAARLFGRAVDIAPVATPRLRGVKLPWRRSDRGATRMTAGRDTEAGLVPAQAETRPALRSNARPTGARGARTLVRRRDRLPVRP